MARTILNLFPRRCTENDQRGHWVLRPIENADQNFQYYELYRPVESLYDTCHLRSNHQLKNLLPELTASLAEPLLG